MRKVLKDFTFSNGITVPAGSKISIPHRSIHRDPVCVQSFSSLISFTDSPYFSGILSWPRHLWWVQVRKNAWPRRRKYKTFNGDSYAQLSNLRTRASCMVLKKSFLYLTKYDLTYNLSPGRFFATNEVKTMLAYVLLSYDVKMPNGRGHPSESWFGTMSIPDPTAEVMFRKRTCAWMIWTMEMAFY